MKLTKGNEPLGLPEWMKFGLESEVDDILTFSDDTILSRIPKSFLQFVRENKDKSHITNINPYLALEEYT